MPVTVASKFDETRGGLSAGGLRVVTNQSCPEDIPMLRLGRPSAFGGPNAQTAYDVVI